MGLKLSLNYVSGGSSECERDAFVLTELSQSLLGLQSNIRNGMSESLPTLPAFGLGVNRMDGKTWKSISDWVEQLSHNERICLTAGKKSLERKGKTRKTVLKKKAPEGPER